MLRYGLERHKKTLNDIVEKLGTEIAGLPRTVASSRRTFERITERLPDQAHGPLEKARDFPTGSGDSGTAGGS